MHRNERDPAAELIKILAIGVERQDPRTVGRSRILLFEVGDVETPGGSPGVFFADDHFRFECLLTVREGLQRTFSEVDRDVAVVGRQRDIGGLDPTLAPIWPHGHLYFEPVAVVLHDDETELRSHRAGVVEFPSSGGASSTFDGFGERRKLGCVASFRRKGWKRGPSSGAFAGCERIDGVEARWCGFGDVDLGQQRSCDEVFVSVDGDRKRRGG